MRRRFFTTDIVTDKKGGFFMTYESPKMEWVAFPKEDLMDSPETYSLAADCFEMPTVKQMLGQ